MDRTADFLRTLSGVVIICNIPATSENPYNQFQQAVSGVTRLLRDLEKLLEQLISLAKCKTLFDDKTREVDLVSTRVKNALQQISGNIDQLERKFLNDGSRKDALAHRNTVISTLRNQTMLATKKFTEALQTRRQALETIEARRGIYGNSGIRDIEAQDDILEVDRGPEQHQQSAIMQAYHHSRSEAVEQVQRMIGEVSTMFQKVATLVGQQEEMVLRIDATVDDSLTRLREGQFQLLKYFTQLKGQRALILKLIAMLTAFAVFFIVFLA